MSKVRKLIFIIGMAHSGTSWINAWLKRHPNIVGGPETYLLSELLKFEQRIINEKWSRKTEYVRIRRYCKHVFKIAADNNENMNILVHDCNLLAFGKELDQVFFEAYYILVHRDGRRVTASLKQRVGTVSKTLYNRWIEQSKLIIEGKLPKNCLILRYDDLAKNPKLSRTITNFIEINHHCDIDSEELINCSFGKKMPEDCWKTLLPEMDFSEMDDLLEKLGYRV